MTSIYDILQSHRSGIIGTSFTMMIGGMLFGSRMASVAIGLFLIAPLSIAMIRDKRESTFTLLAKAIKVKTLYYTILYLSLWIIPICLPAFLTTWINTELLFIVVAVPIYSYLYTKVAPTFFEIAVGQRGKSLDGNDLLKIMLTMTLYFIVEKALYHAATFNPYLMITAYAGLSFLFTTTLCLQTAIVIQRNELES